MWVFTIRSLLTQYRKEKFMEVVLCPNCKTEMELIGITDRAVWRFYCPKCYTIIGRYNGKTV